MGWFEEGNGGHACDVVALLDSEAGKRLHALVAEGALISMGLTSDGGALGITVTVDGAWRREYFRDAEALDIWTEEAMAPVVEACAARRASSVPRQRTRGTRGR